MKDPGWTGSVHVLVRRLEYQNLTAAVPARELKELRGDAHWHMNRTDAVAGRPTSVVDNFNGTLMLP
jgi:hypothetical protein